MTMTTTSQTMNDFKATPEHWKSIKEYDTFVCSCILELRARVAALEEEQTELVNSYHFVVKAITERLEKLEAQANHFGDTNKMVPPPVATDEELRDIWDRAFDLRAIYNLGVAHGQAGSREVAEPAPVAGGLVARVAEAIHEQLNEAGNWEYEARAARRPKPPSLKEQAYAALDTYIYGNPDHGDKQNTYNTLRKALDQLND